MKTFKKLLLWGQVVSWEPGDQEIPGLTTKVYSGVFKGKIQFPCGFYRIRIIWLKTAAILLKFITGLQQWGIQTRAVRNDGFAFTHKCDLQQFNFWVWLQAKQLTLVHRRGTRRVGLQKSQTFPEVPWAGHSGLHQWRKGQLCTWWVEMDSAVPQRNSNLSHVCTANKEWMSLFTNQSPQSQLTAVGMCISRSMTFVESKAALSSEAGIN